MDNPSNLPLGEKIIASVRAVKTPEEKDHARSVRKQVFIEEQNVPPELEYDAHDEDPQTVHFIAYSNGIPQGAARLRPYSSNSGKIERVAVLKEARGQGIGALLMVAIEEQAVRRGFNSLKLNAQLHAEPFYRRIGYSPIGNVFLEADIEHIAMEKELES
ncbi:GNAT family N-acetyltransferase [Ammoniphilus sp. 3BR4]|uniref:GNAT family N-acetyltransferase n=1 Tax=Ammoniphilus sp. 3BR4 TaxID=3158265 RepID=UPI003466EC99